MYHGDGYCDDYRNKEACFFDGGDCCGSNINTAYCNECICYEDIDCKAPLEWIGDGFCDDKTNNEGCQYDGGDCCGPNVNTAYCSDCICCSDPTTCVTTTSQATTTPFGTTGSNSCNQGWIGDGYCDDINNNQYCNFDGGDCCGSNANTDWCTECLCLEDQDTTSSSKMFDTYWAL